MSAPVDPSFPSDALELFPFDVLVSRVIGRNRYNVVEFDDGTLYRAYIEAKRRLTTNAAGEDVVSNYTVYLASSDDVEPESVVLLPDGRSKDVLSVTRNADEVDWYITTLHL